jgi:hypothetical protein
VDSLFHELFDVLEVAHHSFLEVLLSVSGINIVHHLTSDLVDDNRNSANASILTFSGASGVSAVAVADFKTHQLNSFGNFFDRDLQQTSLSGWESDDMTWRFTTI